MVASRAATAGGSTCVPGVVSEITCRSTPCSSEHLLPVRDVAVAAHHHVVVAGVVHDRIALGVVRDAQRASRRFERVEVLGRVVVIVNVDDHRRDQRKYTGKPINTIPNPMALSPGTAEICITTIAAETAMKTIGTAG